VLRAKSDNEFLVSLLLAGLVEDTHVRLATVEGLGSLAETTGKTVVDQGDLEDALERIVDGHLAAAGLGGDLDILGLGDGGVGNGLFSVRLCKIQMLDIFSSENIPATESVRLWAYHCDGVIWWVVINVGLSSKSDGDGLNNSSFKIWCLKQLRLIFDAR
jgi:hypothetical protein